MSTERFQKIFTLPPHTKGTYLITEDVLTHIQDGLANTKIGILHLFIQHTSAALSINENFDPDVRHDMTMALDRIVPEDAFPWTHVDEGPDDSVSHTKCSIIGPSIQIPVSNGKLALGTWQGIYLLEFRAYPHRRKLVATIL